VLETWWHYEIAKAVKTNGKMMKQQQPGSSNSLRNLRVIDRSGLYYHRL